MASFCGELGAVHAGGGGGGKGCSYADGMTVVTVHLLKGWVLWQMHGHWIEIWLVSRLCVHEIHSFYRTLLFLWTVVHVLSQQVTYVIVLEIV